MTKKYDAIVFIARCQPVHNAHIQTIKMATELAKQVIIILGSSQQPRTYKNPWSFQERESMLIPAIRHQIPENKCMIRIESNFDTIYDDLAWSVRIQNLVKKHTLTTDKIALIGHSKPGNGYLNMFPQWDRIETPTFEALNATDIRELYFKKDANLNYISSVIPTTVLEYLKQFQKNPGYQQVIREKEFVAQYKKQFQNLPYPPIFVTVDAVVVQSGNVLMVKRRSEPGKGLWALPGGFLDAQKDKSVEDAMIRELYEETAIAVPEKVIRGSIKEARVFDAIDRSARGRTITHAFKIVFNDGEWKLPKVKGMDDAEVAQWVPFSKLKSEDCFEDHREIIQAMVGI